MTTALRRVPGRLLTSLAEAGQQVPILVVAGTAPARHVVIDPCMRVRSLKKLARDVVQAARLDMEPTTERRFARCPRTTGRCQRSSASAM